MKGRPPEAAPARLARPGDSSPFIVLSVAVLSNTLE